MQKKIIIIFTLFLSTTYQQFTALYTTPSFLQRIIDVPKNSIFTNEFLSLCNWYKYSPIQEVRLFSQVHLDNDLKNKIFKLAVEEEAAVKILLSKNAAQEEVDTLDDMYSDGIDIAILSKDYRFINWQERFSNKQCLHGFKITNNKQIPSLMTAALISYQSGSNVVLLGKPRETLCIRDGNDFAHLQRKFDYVFAKSKR